MSTPEYTNGREKAKAGVFTSPRPAASRTGSVVHRGRRASRTFDFGDLDADEMLHVARIVGEHGDLVCFGLTSDAGALCTTVVCDAVRHKVYCATASDCYVAWSDLLQTLY